MVGALLWSRNAAAEIPIVEADGWTLYTEGRFNAFISYTQGDGYPQPQDGIVSGSGVVSDLDKDGNNKINNTRVRSGFLGNILAFGLRRNLTPNTVLKGYYSMWATIETNRTRYLAINPDVRESYLKLEGPWGSFLGGRTLGLYSRGSVEIDFNYAHGNGMGFPCTENGDIGSRGPACGQIGFGVIFPFFASGLVYATPKIAGFTLTAGIYDPVILAGKWERTPLPRAEGELAFDANLGSLGKVHLFGTALWQRLGKQGVNDSGTPATATTAAVIGSTDAYGVAGGGRVEVGPVRLGVAGHTGRGIGFAYALQNSAANYTQDGTLRTFDGLYAQLMVVLGRVDLAAGWGVSRAHLFDSEIGDVTASVPKQQQGINAGIFIHTTKYLVVGIDYFRADFEWYLGQKQGLNFYNAGVTAVF